MRALTPKQRRFVEEYLKDLNATQAYLRAGYKTTPLAARNHASRLMAKDNIAEAIRAGQAELSKRILTTADDVVRDLIMVKNHCMSDEAFNPVGACRALELIGKHLGMFVERRVNTNIEVQKGLTGLDIWQREFGPLLRKQTAPSATG